MCIKYIKERMRGENERTEKKRRKEINMNIGCAVRITNIWLPRRV